MKWTLIDIDYLKRVDLFSRVSPGSLEQLATLIYTRNFRRGQRIFENGAPARRMYLINAGNVRISREVPGFESEVLALLESGSYFGESALMSDGVRSADAWAETECSLGIIEGQELKQMMASNPELAEELLWVFVRTLARRLRSTNQRMANLVEDMHR
ncbi:MAG: cyclic nucleotide-binding domain-containing protein [Myxococcota bacterium]